MTYALDIELDDPLEAAFDDIVGEMEEALDNISKYRKPGLTHQVDVDFDELLAKHHAIGIVWESAHVKDQRPELTDEQAWQVLQECQRSWERLNDPMLKTIRQVADNLYPKLREARPSTAGQIIADYGNGDERENLVDLLADTLHWCEAFGEPFDEFYGSAKLRFAEEVKTYQKGV